MECLFVCLFISVIRTSLPYLAPQFRLNRFVTHGEEIWSILRLTACNQGSLPLQDQRTATQSWIWLTSLPLSFMILSERQNKWDWWSNWEWWSKHSTKTVNRFLNVKLALVFKFQVSPMKYLYCDAFYLFHSCVPNDVGSAWASEEHSIVQCSWDTYACLFSLGVQLRRRRQDAFYL